MRNGILYVGLSVKASLCLRCSKSVPIPEMTHHPLLSETISLFYS